MSSLTISTPSDLSRRFGAKLRARPEDGDRIWVCGTAGCDGEPHDMITYRHARAAQVAPVGVWLIWLILAGRGFGKTRAGAEWIAANAKQMANSRWALVGATLDDVRDTMVEGESGLLSVLPSRLLRGQSIDTAWNRSLGELFLANGARFKGFSSERPNKLRGPQHHGAWCDEPASWKDADKGDADDTTWSNLMLGLRLGADPRACVTGTPKSKKLLRGSRDENGQPKPGLIGQAEATRSLTRGSTYDNLANLAPTFRAQILARYEGTRLGRQELNAELLDEIDGALWTYSMIDDHRIAAAPEELRQVVVAVDPAGGGRDETGIAVCGSTPDKQGVLLADRSCKDTPNGWARRAIRAYEEFAADRIVAETNYGGDMVEATLRSAGYKGRFEKVVASRGKAIRAEPIAALYEQGRVHHVGLWPALEDQLTQWTPDSGESPDRLDALVWGFTALKLAQYGQGAAFADVWRQMAADSATTSVQQQPPAAMSPQAG